MNSAGKTIAKNAGAMMASQLTTWTFAIILMIFLPRYLGAFGVGQYHLAVSIWGIAGMLAAFGMDVLLTKEIARKPSRIDELFGTSLVLRLLLYGLGFAAVAIYANLAGYAAETLNVIYIIGVEKLFAQLMRVCQASLQGLERMEYISIAEIGGKAFNTIAGIVILLLGYGVLVYAMVVVVATGISFLFQFYFLKRLRPLKIRFNWFLARKMLRASFPYLLVTIFQVVYRQVDVVFISLLVNEKGVGWYSAADQLFGTLFFVPTIFVTVVFPVLSRMYMNETDMLPRFMRKSFDMLLLVGIPIGLGTVAIAKPLVVMLFGDEFANSGPILAVMGIVLIFTYQNILLGRFLISVDRQNFWTVVMAVAMLATIPLDLVFIPWSERMFGNGAIGGAISFVVTEMGMLIAGLIFLPRGLLGWSNVWVAVRVLLAGGGMLAAVWPWREAFIGVPLAIGAAAYLVLILLLRLVPKEDWVLIKSLLHSVSTRFRKRRATATELGG